MSKEGDRVIAISHSDGDTLYIFGYGTYLGDMNPTELSEKHYPAGQLGQIVTEMPDITNPCIKLDNGQIVWGCECWWSPLDSERLQAQLSRFKDIIELDIQEQRSKYRKE